MASSWAQRGDVYQVVVVEIVIPRSCPDGDVEDLRRAQIAGVLGRDGHGHLAGPEPDQSQQTPGEGGGEHLGVAHLHLVGQRLAVGIRERRTEVRRSVPRAQYQHQIPQPRRPVGLPFHAYRPVEHLTSRRLAALDLGHTWYE